MDATWLAANVCVLSSATNATKTRKTHRYACDMHNELHIYRVNSNSHFSMVGRYYTRDQWKMQDVTFSRRCGHKQDRKQQFCLQVHTMSVLVQLLLQEC